ncbi:MAG: hypothetical protein ACK5X3_01405 [Pseudomonadota bacterium]
MSGAYRNADVVHTGMDGTLHAKRWAVVAERSDDDFESWWDDVVVARCATEAEAVEFARHLNEGAA